MGLSINWRDAEKEKPSAKFRFVRYRIMPDNYLGWEVRIWRLWWPFWMQCDFTNTFSTVENAKNYIDNRRNPIEPTSPK